MGVRMLHRMFLLAGAGVMLAAIVAVSPAAATSAPRGQGYTWTTIDVPGSVATVPVAVNDLGVVVGAYYANSSDLNSGVSQGFVEWGGRYATIDDPLAVSSAVYSMNDLGEIVGTYQDGSGVNYGYMYQHGRFTTIEDPNAANIPGLFGTTVASVNDFGTVVGYYVDSDGTMHAFVYKNGRYTTDTCPSAGTGPNSSDYDVGAAGTFFGYVDNAGAMIGTCFLESTGYYNFIYQAGRFNPVPNVPGSSSSWISWVTDSGESGGWYFTSPSVTGGGAPDGYVYQYGRFTTIGDPAGPYGIYLDGANDFGAIAGYYLDISGDVNGFLLTPSH